MKHTWRILKDGTPGDRFCRYYREHEGHESRRSHLAQVGLAVLMLVVGFILLFIPGPGIVFLAVGAAMLARESMATAKFLDRLELRIRRILHR